MKKAFPLGDDWSCGGGGASGLKAEASAAKKANKRNAFREHPSVVFLLSSNCLDRLQRVPINLSDILHMQQLP